MTWTTEEDEFLIQNDSDMTNLKIADVLNKSVYAVQWRRKKLGLPNKRRRHTKESIITQLKKKQIVVSKKYSDITSKDKILVNSLLCGHQWEAIVFDLFKSPNGYCPKCSAKENGKRFRTGTKNIPGKRIAAWKQEAKERNIEWDVEDEYLQKIWDTQNGKCAISGIEIYIGYDYHKSDVEITASLDRIDSNRGYIKNNIQWVHKVVNAMKWNLPENKFVALCKKVRDRNK